MSSTVGESDFVKPSEPEKIPSSGRPSVTAMPTLSIEALLSITTCAGGRRCKPATWHFSADREGVAVPDSKHPGCFTEIRSDPEPSKRWQVSLRISGMTDLLGMNPGISKGKRLDWSHSGNPSLNQVILSPYFLAPFRFTGIPATGVFSNDGKYVATLNDGLTRNVWSVDQ